LGKAYSASAMNDRFMNHKPSLPTGSSAHDQTASKVRNLVNPSTRILPEKQVGCQTILGDLLNTEHAEETAFAGMIQKKRKKKRKRLTS
ncbi:MAG: hypothetical protein Q8L01_01785, partial [Candidatus Woesebacteria bacterium]|nr:hypothetical protein [Candidatus Woesebacteria bacterium]